MRSLFKAISIVTLNWVHLQSSVLCFNATYLHLVLSVYSAYLYIYLIAFRGILNWIVLYLGEAWLLRPICLYVRAVTIVHDLILCKTRISMCNFVGYIVAVDSVSPTVFIISEAGDLIKWFDCSDYMREPSDIAVSGREFFVCDFKVASSLSMY